MALIFYSPKNFTGQQYFPIVGCQWLFAGYMIRCVPRIVKNPDKTQQGEFISAYECDIATIDVEFLLLKNQYHHKTGRRQNRKNDVLAYQIRQAFKPGKITPEETNPL